MVDAAVEAVAMAVTSIDLTRHAGVHPRLGAADVVPLVPVQGITLDECVALAHGLGKRLWEQMSIPVYFYEAAALQPERQRLETVRRGGFEGVRAALGRREVSRQPDIGGPELHPTAGAVIVGARRFLIAWNVNLETADVEIAKSIAYSIRESSGGFRYLKALGLPLKSRQQVQVSMNLTDFEATPMHVVFRAICDRAAAAGVKVAGTEIIGLLPQAALFGAAEAYFHFENFTKQTVLEERVRAALRR